MPNELLWKLANFAVLAGGLGYLIAKNAGPYFRTRGEDIQQGIVDAAQVRAEAEVRAAAIEKKIGNLSGEIESIRAASKAEIAAEAARVQEETEAQIAKVRRQARDGDRIGHETCEPGVEGVLGAARARAWPRSRFDSNWTSIRRKTWRTRL